MKVFLGSDHGGFEDKEHIEAYLMRKEIDVEDVGAKTLDPDDDYPQFAAQTVSRVLGSTDQDPRGILLCRGGQGMAIAANRHAGIRAVVLWSEKQAEKARADNDSNVLCLPSDALTVGEMYEIIDTWLSTPFSGAARHARRLKEIDSFYPNT